MKIPKAFIPEKNLDNKVEDLVKEKNVPNLKPTGVEKKELEELLNLFDRFFDCKGEPFNITHKKIDIILNKSDYRPLKIKGCFWEYWYRPSAQNFDESYIFIRSFDKHNKKHYAFARVDNLKLESFCRLFEKYETGVISGINHNKPYSSIGMITGALGGIALLFVNPALINTIVSFVPMAGLIGGALGGTYLSRYMHRKYAKNLLRCYEEIETFSKNAVKKAFET